MRRLVLRAAAVLFVLASFGFMTVVRIPKAAAQAQQQQQACAPNDTACQQAQQAPQKSPGGCCGG